MIEPIRDRLKLVERVVRQPKKLIYLLTTRAGLKALRYLIAPPKHGGLDQASRVIGVRRYSSYDDYVRHQRSKLGLVDLRDYDKRFRADLADRLGRRHWAGKSVLCIAARIGTEVRAFHDVGAFAVGIDLEPGKNNSWVLPGDFHSLVFPDDCVDAVYCNSLDHALDLGKLLNEVKRVLKPSGSFLIDAQTGNCEFDDWAATSWQSIDDLIDAIMKAGFALEQREPITIPQVGEHLRFIQRDEQKHSDPISTVR